MGASVEFAPYPGGERQVGGVNVVHRARLAGIGVVDSGAYVGATVEARELQLRQDGQGLEGAVFYDTDHVISDRAGNPAKLAGFPELQVRASTRKERYAPGAFAFALGEPDREVSVLMGRDYDRPLGSKLGGTVEFDDGPDALRFLIPTLPPVPYVDDFRRLLASGAAVFGVAPLFRIALAGRGVRGADTGAGESRTRLSASCKAAVLTALAIVTRARPVGNPGAWYAIRHDRAGKVEAMAVTLTIADVAIVVGNVQRREPRDAHPERLATEKVREYLGDAYSADGVPD